MSATNEGQFRGRSAVVWETDENGVTLHYFTEVGPEMWKTVGYQWQHSNEITAVWTLEGVIATPTDKLAWCADGGTIINLDGTFTGIEV